MKGNSGFTLIELMVTIAISAILLGIGVPSLSEFVKNNRRAAAVNMLVSDIQRARNLSLVRRSRIVMCRSIDNETCAAGTSMNNWADGWLLFVDENRNNALDTGDELIGAQSALGNVRIPANVTFLRFNPSGTLPSNGGSLAICVDERNETGRRLTVTPSGRPRISEITTGSPNCS